MAELIDRVELRKFPIRIDHYDKENGSLDFVLGIETVFEYIEYLPTIEAKPVVHAHWIIHKEEKNNSYYQCSHCTYGYKTNSIFPCVKKYCSDCGAQMDEKENENG